MKIYNEYEPMFRNYLLTDLMIVKNGKRKGVAENLGVSALTDNFLKPYGINLWYNWTGIEGLRLRGCTLDKKFPVENFPILHQMYSWLNVDIYICLSRTSECEYGFTFRSDTDEVVLQKHVWGEVKEFAVFNSFADFWAARKKVRRDYGKLLIPELV